MRQALLLSFCLLSMASAVNAATDYTSYTSVAGWKNCVVANKTDYYTSYCLAPNKPESCPVASWGLLKAKLPDCPLCPKNDKASEVKTNETKE